MPEQAKVSSGSLHSNETRSIAPAFLLLSRTVLILLLISVAAALFPIQPWQSLWYLKLGQVAVDYGVTLLFSLGLLLLAEQVGRSRRGSSSPQSTSVKRFCSIAFAVYLGLVPVQLFAYGMHWLQTSQQNNQLIRQAQTQVAKLRSRVRDATSEAELRAAIGEQAPPSLRSMNAPVLLEQKKRVLDAVDSGLFQLRARLKGERQKRLATLAVSTAKGVLGAGALAFGLAGIRRMQPTL